MTSRTRAGLLLSTAVLLTACQALPASVRPYTPSFKLQAPAAGSKTVVVTGAAGDLARPPGQAGTLTVSFDHLLPAGKRQLLATAADVEKVTIRLVGLGVDHTETILRAAISNGQTSYTFMGLPPGDLSVTITAYDASNAVIGLDVKSATITAGQTTVVASSVLLAPTAPAPRVIVGGGSGGPGTTGTLTVNVDFVGDTPVITPPIRGVFAPGANTSGIHYLYVTLDAQGNAWFTGPHASPEVRVNPTDGAIARVSPGDVLEVLNVPGTVPLGLASNPDRSLIFVSEPSLEGNSLNNALSLTPMGAVGRLAPPNTFGTVIAAAADGTVYYAPEDLMSFGVRIDQISPAGVVAPFDAPYGGMALVTAIACGPAGHVASLWHTDSTAGYTFTLRRNGPDGTLLFERSYANAPFYGANGLAIDSQGAIWMPVPSRRVIEKLSPTGTLLATCPVVVPCDAVTLDDAGRLWAYATGVGGGEKDFIVRLSASGAVEAYYYVGANLNKADLAVSADDHMWLLEATKGLIHLKLDPLAP